MYRRSNTIEIASLHYFLSSRSLNIYIRDWFIRYCQLFKELLKPAVPVASWRIKIKFIHCYAETIPFIACHIIIDHPLRIAHLAASLMLSAPQCRRQITWIDVPPPSRADLCICNHYLKSRRECCLLS